MFLKWFLAIFVFLVFSVLSYNGFIQNDLGSTSVDNRFMKAMVDIYQWLLNAIGGIPTGFLFAFLAIGTVVLFILDKKKASKK